MKIPTFAFAGFAAAFAALSAAAETLEPGEARATAAAFADTLETGYLDPGTGAAYAAKLRAEAGAGAYEGFTDPDAFAAAVNQDIAEIYPDGHLKLRFGEPGLSGEGDAEGEPEEANVRYYEDPYWIADGVVAAKWSIFTGEPDSVAAAEALIADFVGARAVVFDFREHHGGGLAEHDVLYAGLFDVPTRLVSMIMRDGKGGPFVDYFNSMPSVRRLPTEDGVHRWEHWSVPGPHAGGWRETKVFVLTSGRTASSAEHFVLALKTTGRAVIIGETTRGAGNFGGFEKIGERFHAFVPVGSTLDPATGKGWDAVGIAPDIETPADEALDRALEEIGALN